MKKLQCLIVDDEELARVLLTNYISRIPSLELVAQCKNPIEAIEIINRNKIDLIFLDIQMPELSGIEFLKSMSLKPDVIITTAYDNYAIQGFELNAVDYLLKPFGFERFLQATQKVFKLQKMRSYSPKENNTNPQESTERVNHILVQADYKVYRLGFKDILYIQGMREYVAFHLVNTKRILSLMTLKSLDTELDSTLFMRVHKSYIVAKKKINALEGQYLIIGEHKIPIGPSYKEMVLQHLF